MPKAKSAPKKATTKTTKASALAKAEVDAPVLVPNHFYEASVADGPKFYGEAISESAIHPWSDGRPVGDPVEIGAAFVVNEISREQAFDASNSIHQDTFEVSL